MADITPHTVLDVDLLKIETGIHEKLSHEQLIWEYIDGTLEKVHSQQLEAMCFLLRAQNGVELTFLLVYILLHKATGCLQQHRPGGRTINLVGASGIKAIIVIKKDKLL